LLIGQDQDSFHPGYYILITKNSDFKRSITKAAKIYSFIIKESLKTNEQINTSAITDAKKILGVFTEEGTLM